MSNLRADLLGLPHPRTYLAAWDHYIAEGKRIEDENPCEECDDSEVEAFYFARSHTWIVTCQKCGSESEAGAVDKQNAAEERY